jgi:hypothetical protein
MGLFWPLLARSVSAEKGNVLAGTTGEFAAMAFLRVV